MDKNNMISTREKIGALIKRFLKTIDQQKNCIFEYNTLVNQGLKIFKDYKKALDMVFYFEALGLLLKISAEHAIYVGFRGMVRKLSEYENNHKNPHQFFYEETTIQGKITSIKAQLLTGQLFSDIFYGLIYQKQSTTKSSIEEIVENFMYQQKEVNLKNFVNEILNILGVLGLIEKNEATQVINYVGPDLKCFDENCKKDAAKIFEINRKQEQAIGKQPIQMQLEAPKPQTETTSNLPVPVHTSYFPQLCFAVLRSNNWQKRINKTVFFIGRNQKRSSTNDKQRHSKVDLDLPHKSISRQHALIVYNYEAQRWEIRCLSKKNLIRVDRERFAWGDKNIWLKNKSQIQIGPQKIIFLQIKESEQ